MNQKSAPDSSVWLDIKSYIPLDKFFHIINQTVIAHFITIFLFYFTNLFGKTHHLNLTVSYASTAAALLPILTYMQSRSQQSAQDFSDKKKLNAKAHAILLIVTYAALLFDNFMYCYDPSVYCSKEELEKGKTACDAKISSLWMLDILCFVMLLTWLSCVRALFQYAARPESEPLKEEVVELSTRPSSSASQPKSED